MYYTGTLNFLTKEDALKMVKSIQNEEICLDYIDYLSEKDIQQDVCAECFISIDGERCIENDLQKMADYAKDHHIAMDFSIEYYDDDIHGYGCYEFHNGEFEVLRPIKYSIRNAGTEDLIKELKRRGYNIYSLLIH